MRLYNKLLASLGILFCLQFVVSCDLGKKTHREFTFEELITHEDTVEVKELIATFFNFTITQEYDEAAAMLYRIDPQNPKGQPILLDNEEMTWVVNLLQTFPAVDYKIEYLKFYQAYENEAMCRIIISKGQDGAPDVTSKIFLKPLFYLGKWSLGIMNTAWGDKGIVDPSDRDSVSRAYRMLQKDSI